MSHLALSTRAQAAAGISATGAASCAQYIAPLSETILEPKPWNGRRSCRRKYMESCTSILDECDRPHIEHVQHLTSNIDTVCHVLMQPWSTMRLVLDDQS